MDLKKTRKNEEDIVSGGSSKGTFPGIKVQS